MNYYYKYLKYRNKYLSLKKDIIMNGNNHRNKYLSSKKDIIMNDNNHHNMNMIGGNRIIVNLDYYKDLFRNCINEIPNELGFNLLYDDMISFEVIKGTYNSITFPYNNVVNIHTHPFALELYKTFKYHPPTHKDYIQACFDYFKGTQFNIIVEKAGVWYYTPNKELINEIEKIQPNAKEIFSTMSSSVTGIDLHDYKIDDKSLIEKTEDYNDLTKAESDLVKFIIQTGLRYINMTNSVVSNKLITNKETNGMFRHLRQIHDTSSHRKASHKSRCNTPTNKSYNFKIYQMIRENGGWENWFMIEIESRLVKDKREAERIEQEWIEKLQTNMNSMRAFVSEEYQKQYYIENADKKKEVANKWYYDNIDKRKEYDRLYRIENLDKKKEIDKLSRLKNIDKRKEYNRQYRIKNADKMKEKDRLYKLKKKEEKITSPKKL
jgi:hypothetical protein